MGTAEKFKNKIYKIVGRIVVKKAAKKVLNKITEKKKPEAAKKAVEAKKTVKK